MKYLHLKIWFSFLFLLCICNPSQSSGPSLDSGVQEVYSIYTMRSMKNALPFINQKIQEYRVKPSEVLVTIGIDRVIYHPTNVAMQAQNIHRYGDKLAEILTGEEKYLMYSMFTKEGELVLVEPEVMGVIKSLQELGIPAIGQIASLVGPLPGIESNEKWVAGVLKEKFEIDFSKAFPDKTNFVLTDLPSYRGYQPCFDEGILFVNGRGDKGSKREAHISFLKHIGFSPKLSFNINDLSDAFLTSDEARKLGTAYYGLEYKYAYSEEALSNPDKVVDLEVFEQTWINFREKIRAKILTKE